MLSSVVTLLYCSTCSSITDAKASPSSDALIDVLLVAWVKLLMSRRVYDGIFGSSHIDELSPPRTAPLGLRLLHICFPLLSAYLFALTIS